MLMGDRRKVKQILINLLSNAVKFTPPHGRISVRASMDPDGSVAIQVADTGIGIDADDFSKAMAPFSQVDGSLSRQYEGTGLGLSIVKALIELHDGSFGLESAVGVGTTATIRFPANRVHDRVA